ncbi:MAG TPA: hypothetical protein VI520_00020, partial [Anaerolineales bacterium]|nr:hypothetical protein [Anaerolineales bacterium]
MNRSIFVSLLALAALAACRPQPEVPASPTVEPNFVEAETLDTLRSAAIPMADPEDLARRLSGVTQDIPATLEPPAAPRKVAARDRFWIT